MKRQGRCLLHLILILLGLELLILFVLIVLQPPLQLEFLDELQTRIWNREIRITTGESDQVYRAFPPWHRRWRRVDQSPCHQYSGACP